MEKKPIHAMKTRGLIPIAIGLTFGRCRFFLSYNRLLCFPRPVGFAAAALCFDMFVCACVRAGGAFSDKLAVELSSCFFRDLFSPCGL